MNTVRGRWENFWASEQTSVVLLVDSDDIIDKMVYALANPVKDHLVERASQWPGMSSLDATLRGHSLVAHRPKHFFRDDGPMPKTITLSFQRPPGFEDLSQEGFSNLLRERVAEVEANAARERRRAGRKAMGVAGVVKQRWQDRPSSVEPRRVLDPRVAARNKWRRIEAIQRNKLFQCAYFAARMAFGAGRTDVVFPPGTYWLCRFAGVSCVPAPAS